MGVIRKIPGTFGRGKKAESDSVSPAPTRQRTLSNPIHCSGIGLHSGRNIVMTLNPAPVDSGIVFHRTDLPPVKGGGANPDRVIPALWDHVVDTMLCTTIGNAAGVTVGTVEHLMSALAGCGVDNVEIELDGPEVPVMDGSSAPFVFLIECAGIDEQDAPRKVIRILKEVTVEDGDKRATLSPDEDFTVEFEIEFENALVGRQHACMRVEFGVFKTEISRARTFGFLEDVAKMHAAGLAKGGSLDNAVVVSGDKILNEGGLRYEDEFVRHKVLDSIGDLYMAGRLLRCSYHGVKSGHALNNKLLRALFDDPEAWALVEDIPAAPTFIAAPAPQVAMATA